MSPALATLARIASITRRPIIQVTIPTFTDIKKDHFR